MTNYYEYNKEFKGKVDYAWVKAAIAVMAEEATIKNHVERVAYAKTILDGTAPMQKVYMGFATNTAIKTKLLDSIDPESDLDFVSATLFNAFSGVAL